MDFRALILALLGALLLSCDVATGQSLDQADQAALVSFYKSLQSVGTLDWNTNLDLCSQSLPTIICDRTVTPYRVKALAIKSMGIVGTLPTALTRLTAIQLVLISSNAINGTIPTVYGTMSSVKLLALDGNSLTGTIPSQLASIPQLQLLSLEGNLLTGTIPSEIFLKTTLETLLLANNRLTGTLPSSLTQLQSLISFDVSSNSLSGPLPTAIGGSAVTSLLLNNNSFTGNVAKSLFTSPVLETLHVLNNQLDCPIGDYSTVLDSDYLASLQTCQYSCGFAAAQNPCLNSGVCSPRPGFLYACSCAATFSGESCEVAATSGGALLAPHAHHLLWLCLAFAAGAFLPHRRW